MTDKTAGWLEFVTIVEEGSISAAARKLNVPRASLSRKLSALEAQLNTRLIHRTTQHLSVSSSGQLLFEHAKRILADAQYAIDLLHAEAIPSGPLRISAPPASAALDDLFLDFAAAHPKIDLIVHQSNRMVDIINEQFDVALRAGTLQNDNLIVRQLLKQNLIAVASTHYIETHGRPTTLDALKKHHCIVGFGGTSDPAPHWPTRSGGKVTVKPKLALSNMMMQIAAMQRGFGIAMVPQMLIQEELDKHTCQHILPDHLGAEASLHLIYPARQYLPARTRAFIDHTIEWINTHPMPNLIER